MLRGIYTAASGMLGQSILTDVLADNLANLGTTGFKKNSVAFKDFNNVLARELINRQDNKLGNYSMSMAPQPTYLNMSQGHIVETGNPLNVAISGDGFFEVDLGGGQVGHTRDGRFTMDANGTLTDVNGNPIKSSTGNSIVVPPGSSEVQINTKGQVMVYNIPGQPPAIVGQIKVVEFPNPSLITNVGNGFYTSPDQPKPASNYQLQQGMLEESNVNAIREMLDSMVGLRTYEVMQKSINMQNDTLGKAVNDLGRI